MSLRALLDNVNVSLRRRLVDIPLTHRISRDHTVVDEDNQRTIIRPEHCPRVGRCQGERQLQMADEQEGEVFERFSRLPYFCNRHANSLAGCERQAPPELLCVMGVARRFAKPVFAALVHGARVLGNLFLSAAKTDGHP